jgi:hypothetical protein
MSSDEEDDCPHCGGSGYLPVSKDSDTFQRLKDKYGDKAWAYMCKKRCVCKKRKQFKRKVGESIYQAEKIEDSPLWDRTDDNLFISSYWDDFLPHIRFVLLRKGLSYFSRLTTDAKLRTIYVGDDDTYQSLESCVAQPQLLIIRLAVLSYKNKAMPGILLESLRTRQFEDDKTTWIVNPPNHPFNKGHRSYSEELERYIDRSFERVKTGTKKNLTDETDQRAESKKVEDDTFGDLL